MFLGGLPELLTSSEALYSSTDLIRVINASATLSAFKSSRAREVKVWAGF